MKAQSSPAGVIKDWEKCIERACTELVHDFGSGIGPEISVPKTQSERDQLKPQDIRLEERLGQAINELVQQGGVGLSVLRAMPVSLGLRPGDVSAMSWSWMVLAFQRTNGGGGDAHEALTALLAPWLMPGGLHDTHGPKSEGAGGCLSEALAGCGDAGPAFDATMRAIGRFANASGGSDCESASTVLGHAMGRARPSVIQAAIAAVQTSLHPRFVPTFASRLGSSFEAAGKRSPERWGVIDQSAGMYLRWCAGLNMDESDYPAENRWPSIWGSLVAREAHAAEVAELWRCHVKKYGERLNRRAIGRSQALLGGLETQEGEAPLSEIDWAGRLFTPVDQALFAGSLSGARALREQGVPWDAGSFDELISRLASRIDLSSPDEEPEEVLARASALGQALGLGEAVCGSIGSTRTSRL